MPKPTSRRSNSTRPPPSSRHIDIHDDIHSKGRYASPRGYRGGPARNPRSRAPSADSRNIGDKPRDRYCYAGDDSDEDYAARRGRAPHGARRTRTHSPYSSCSSRSSSLESHHRHGEFSPSAPSRHRPPHSYYPPSSSAGGGRDASRRPGSDNSSQWHRTRSEDPQEGSERDSLNSRASSRPSSYPCRSSHDSHSRSSSAPHKKEQSVPLSFARALANEAARHALEAGALAALSMRDDPSPWIGKKGGQIAAAAIGAAVVDTFVARQTPKRQGGLRHAVAKQAAQMVIGGLVSPSSSTKVGGRRK